MSVRQTQTIISITLFLYLNFSQKVIELNNTFLFFIDKNLQIEPFCYAKKTFVLICCSTYVNNSVIRTVDEKALPEPMSLPINDLPQFQCIMYCKGNLVLALVIIDLSAPGYKTEKKINNMLVACFHEFQIYEFTICSTKFFFYF